MLVSELRQWHWAISWDNPLPADSSSMIAALKKLGRVARTQTKTSVILAPKEDITWRQIRAAIVANLHPKKGNVFYVNLRSKGVFQYGSKTNFLWKSVV